MNGANHHRHAQQFTPEPVRPVRYRLGRSRMHFVGLALRWLAGGIAVALIVLGTTALIARIHATEAALQAAHLQGMAVDHTMCGSR